MIKKKKEKDNVLIDLELINLKNFSLFNFEKLKRKTTKVEIKKLVEINKQHKRNLQQLQKQLESANEKRKSPNLVCVKKILEDFEQMLQYYILMKTNPFIERF